MQVNPVSCRINRLLISCLAFKQARRKADCKSVLVLNGKYMDEIMLACMTLFKMAEKMAAIHHFRTDHNSPCLPPKFCITIVSNFSLALQSFREKSKTMIMKIWAGVNKLHYGLRENGVSRKISIIKSFQISDKRGKLCSLVKYGRIKCPSWVKYTPRSAVTKRWSQVTDHKCKFRAQVTMPW